LAEICPQARCWGTLGTVPLHELRNAAEADDHGETTHADRFSDTTKVSDLCIVPRRGSGACNNRTRIVVSVCSRVWCCYWFKWLHFRVRQAILSWKLLLYCISRGRCRACYAGLAIRYRKRALVFLRSVHRGSPGVLGWTDVSCFTQGQNTRVTDGVVDFASRRSPPARRKTEDGHPSIPCETANYGELGHPSIFV
jgi:hypothetical protein